MPTPSSRRTWGTRFDSLIEPTPFKASVASGPDTGLQPPSNLRDTAARVISHPDATPIPAEKERSNPEHDYPRSSSSAGVIDTSSPPQIRMPHDASVFVASLPSHIPEAELHLQLSEHLSQHATIKHIKLIRDNRGAICAFVQVESPAQAAALIAACNLSQFMDRHIRCEIARAFRTLLVSWTPMMAQTEPQSAQIGGEQGQDARGKALRLRRCRGTRYIQVTHGPDAMQADPMQMQNYSSPRSDDPLSGHGVFLPEGLKEGEIESLRLLLEAFGALEFIMPFDPTAHPQHPGRPSDAAEPPSRDESACMPREQGEAHEHAGPEPKMWAVKWEHRNDAVSAITALQYVPNLFICWSHTYGRSHHPPYTQQLGAPYAQSHSRASSGFYTQPSYPSTPYTRGYTRLEGPAAENTDSNTCPTPEAGVDTEASSVERPAAGPRLQQLDAQTLGLPVVLDGVKTEQGQDYITFSDSDFPPLRGDGGAGGGRGRGKRGAWLGRRHFVRAGAPSPPPISTTLAPVMPQSHDIPHTPDLDSVIEPSPVTPGFPVTPRTPSGGYTPHPEEMRKNPMYASVQTFTGQGFNTPGFDPALSGFVTPYGSGPRFNASYGPTQDFNAPNGSMQAFPPRRLEDGVEKAPDGRELFVGGLDTSAWDEERLKRVFGQYGLIDEVRFVKPGFHAPPHRRAFAFVKYMDQAASQRAIKEEHLRIYEDFKIKVQLRSANPPKRWGYRGRGRFHPEPIRAEHASLDFDLDSSTGEVVDTAKDDDAMEETGHVRFASAPEVVNVHVEDIVEEAHQESVQADASDIFEGAAVSNAVVEVETPHTEENCLDSSMHFSDSDGVPDASMEVQSHSTDTTLTFGNVTISPATPPAELPVHELQSDLGSLTVSATPPPSNPDANSAYAPSSSSSESAPTNTGYYSQTPSWIPPYAIPATQYGPYGYYPQPAPGQSGAEGSVTYPWMAATVYRNVVPFVPWFNPPPGVELAPAPVRPTGYIQRDAGGIFIPVYPPERLGQYMSGTAVDQPQAQPQPGGAAIGNWQNLTPHPQLYPVPYPMQPAMVMPQQTSVQHQSQHQQQQQQPMLGNGWTAGTPGTAYPTQHAPSSAPPPYPTPNTYFPPPIPTAPTTHVRQGMYGHYDAAMHQPPMKAPSRREYMNQQHRGPRESRPSQRRGPGSLGMNGGADQSFTSGAADPQFAYGQMKPNGAQPGMPPSSSNAEWSWNGQSR